MSDSSSQRTVFITGTDTGVGKTVLTALWLDYLLATGRRALAVKPLATGSRADARRLARVLRRHGGRGGAQDGGLNAVIAALNPWFLSPPLAPLVAARQCRRRISFEAVLAYLRARQREAGWLLIEGAGGLLSPLGPSYTARELMRALGCPAVVVARNRLGVINQVLLTCTALAAARVAPAAVVLMAQPRPDASAATNPGVLAEWLAPVPVLECPRLPGVSGGRPPPAGARGLARACLEQLTRATLGRPGQNTEGNWQSPVSGERPPFLGSRTLAGPGGEP